LLNSQSIEKYTTLIIPEGSYGAITDAAKEKIKAWVAGGGTLIGFERAVSWFQSAGVGKFELKKENELKKDDKKEEKREPAKPQPYASIDENRGAKETSGAIFEADVDVTHPLLYGYGKKVMLFKSNNLFMEKGLGAYSNPLTYGENPLVSGYIQPENYKRLKNSSCIGISAVGTGRVIGFTENMAFRAFWLGTTRLIANAIFFGPLVSGDASR
jgi:hypothetical protein